MTLMTRPRPCSDNNGEVRIVPVLLSCVRDMSAIRINVPKDLTRRDKLQSMWKSVKEVKRRFPDLPKLDPEDDMGIDDTTEQGKRFLKAKRRIAALQDRVRKNAIFNAGNKNELVELFNRRRHLERAIATHQQDLKSVQKLALRETLLQMKRVLRRLGHISNDDILTLRHVLHVRSTPRMSFWSRNFCSRVHSMIFIPTLPSRFLLHLPTRHVSETMQMRNEMRYLRNFKVRFEHFRMQLDELPRHRRIAVSRSILRSMPSRSTRRM